MTTVATQAGYALGFTSLEDEVVVPTLPVTGTLPSWLAGSLLRTGPAKFEAGDRQLRHWFDGLAMLHRFTFGQGEVSYGNRFLEGRTERAIREDGVISFAEFATDPCRSLFQRVQTMFAPTEFGDNANVNVVKLGERFLSMTETPIAVEFDPRTLASAGAPFAPPGQVTTAHPHAERGGESMINLAVNMGARSTYRFFRVTAAESGPMETSTLATIPVRNPAYLHSFGLTERYIVLAEFPLVVTPIKLALAARPYIENYDWKPERGTRFTLVDRKTGVVTGPIRTDAFFAFHHVNAYDDGGRVVVDVATYDDAGIVSDLYLHRLRAGSALPTPTLRRFELDPAAGTARHERLIEEGMELAQINYAACNERPYRFAWGAGSRAGGMFDQLVRADVREGTTTTWYEEGCYPGEPVFVTRPGGTAEDDGVLLSVVLDPARGTSYLLVLDAATMAEVARAEVPHHIPFSFHGRFAASVV